jgi:hypothetical protein
VPTLIATLRLRPNASIGHGAVKAPKSVFLHKKRLYQLEGIAPVAGGQADVDAMIFHQSLDLT